MSESIEESVQVTRRGRLHTARLAKRVADLMGAWEESNAPLLRALKAARQLQAEDEQHTRDLALQQYLCDPDSGKQICPGVSIRGKVVLHYDAADALTWALTGHTLAVTPAQLNVEVFERLAKAYPQSVPFVSQTVTYQVMLAKEL